MQQDYNNTINLPKTEFPMRAGLPKREPGFLENWEKNDLYHELMKKNEGKPLNKVGDAVNDDQLDAAVLVVELVHALYNGVQAFFA